MKLRRINESLKLYYPRYETAGMRGLPDKVAPEDDDIDDEDPEVIDQIKDNVPEMLREPGPKTPRTKPLVATGPGD